ncbi:transcriptional regulator, AsnC family protein [gamma proteobacterium IMCC1989]|nr:transcriptional regulator, AsnC family protein [gamma proteobacterium IMCC1989]
MRGPGGFEDFVDVIEKMPEVVECSTVSGEFDFILKIVCEDMSRHLEINNYLLKTCKKIESMKTHFVMDESKRFKGFDIESLAPSK